METRIRTRRTAGALVALAAAAGLAVPAGAQAAAPTLTPSRTTVHTDDTTPAAGVRFHLFGAVWSQGERVPATVRVKTFRQGHWQQLPGAVQQTNRNNRYRLHIALQMTGERMLKVIGDPRDPDIATSRTTITVTVH